MMLLLMIMMIRMIRSIRKTIILQLWNGSPGHLENGMIHPWFAMMLKKIIHPR